MLILPWTGGFDIFQVLKVEGETLESHLGQVKGYPGAGPAYVGEYRI